MIPEKVVLGSAQDLSRPVPEVSRQWWVVPLVLLILAIMIATLRLRTFDEPFERDIVTYLMIGHAMNRGGQVYVDVWDVKPPGICEIYALAEWMVGFGDLQIYLLNIVSAVVTLVGVYAVGATRGRNAGIWAAAFWVLLCGAPSLQANQPNTEVFINACVVWALALLLRASDSSAGIMQAVAVGTLFAVGTTFKQIVIIDAILLSCAHVAFATGLPGGRRRALRDVVIIAAVGAICWFTMIGYYAATGRFEIFYVTNFSNARAYAGNPLFNLFRYVREARFFPRFLRFSAPIGSLVLLGAFRDRRGLGERHWALYLTALLALQIKIALNGTGFLPHYYQYWLPMLAIGAGWTAGVKTPKLGAFPTWTMSVAGAVVGAFLLVQQGYYFLLPADEWSRAKYGMAVLEGRAMGLAIGDVLRPEERLYQHGDRPEFYYYSGHLPPSLLLWTAHLDDTWPVAELLLKRHLAALNEAPPDLVVVENSSPPAPTQKPGLVWRFLVGRENLSKGRNAQTVLDVLLPGYRSAQIEELQGFPGFRFYIRRGSSLDGRVGREGLSLSN